jgi:hypothetical protein
MRKPPITAVGMKSLRNGRDQRRMSAEQANTNESTTSERPISSTLPGMLSSPGGRDPMPLQSQPETLQLAGSERLCERRMNCAWQRERVGQTSTIFDPIALG